MVVEFADPSVTDLRKIDAEIKRLDREVLRLLKEKHEWDDLKTKILKHREEAQKQEKLRNSQKLKSEYENENFLWSTKLRNYAKKFWNISKWRGNQLSIINAGLDKRDVFVIMPTGGGKSLCYQLPALMNPGITLVVSPLLSLINDQVFQLQDQNIPVTALTSNTDQAEAKDIMNTLKLLADDKTRNEILRDDGPNGVGSYPRLIYVTPEKIAKSKRFVSLLEKLNKVNMMNRVVIDECHCCSEMGHDFRPDYRKLGLLRIVLPNVPFMALTATCSQKVVASVTKILGLKNQDEAGGIFLFTSPLWRPNLEYSVVPKASTLQDQIKQMTSWILEKYPNDRGIIYCLTKKETESIAQGIYEKSKRRIAVQIFHSDLDASSKRKIHTDWRDGKVMLVVATIAFGMGINQPNVRYVIHHSCSKSIEGYYQESGRAGRDGKPAQCLLYYRGADFSRLTTWAVTDAGEGLSKAYAMIRYAEDLLTCRKSWMETHFQQFENSSNVDGRECGNCDHCKQFSNMSDQEKQNYVANVDITSDTATLVNILAALEQCNQNITFLKLLDLWMGRGLGKYPMIKQLKERQLIQMPPRKELGELDRERLINHLLLSGYIEEKFHYTAYATHSYLVVGQKGRLLVDLEGNKDISTRHAVSMLMPSMSAMTGGTKRKQAGDKRANTKTKKLARNVQVEADDEGVSNAYQETKPLIDTQNSPFEISSSEE